MLEPVFPLAAANQSTVASLSASPHLPIMTGKQPRFTQISAVTLQIASIRLLMELREEHAQLPCRDRSTIHGR
jgi:hypothetical protein